MQYITIRAIASRQKELAIVIKAVVVNSMETEVGLEVGVEVGESEERHN